MIASRYLLGGLGVVAAASLLGNAFLWSRYGEAQEEIGRLEAAVEIAADANREKANAVKDRARVERATRTLSDRQLIDRLFGRDPAQGQR